MSNSFADLLDPSDENSNQANTATSGEHSEFSNDDQSSHVDSEDLNSSSTFSELDDDVVSLASSVYSTYHSRLRKQERLFDNDKIKKIKRNGCYDKVRVANNSLEIRWKVEYQGNVIILSEDFKTLITCYKEENPAISFYNNLCDRFDTCGTFFTKYETKITLDEFKNEIKGKKMFYNKNFDYWPLNKPILLQTARNGRLDLLKYLIEECNYNPFVVGKGRYSILHYACYSGRYEMIEYLIKNEKLRKLLDMKANNGETGFDALMNSDKLNEEKRRKCAELFNILKVENDSVSTETIETEQSLKLLNLESQISKTTTEEIPENSTNSQSNSSSQSTTQ